MANPIGRYRPPYPTREELLGLTNRNPDPSPTLQTAPLSTPERDSQQSLGEPPPVPPYKDNVPPLPRKDSLSPTRWNEDRSSERAFDAVDAQNDPPSGKTKPWSLVEEIRQRRSEKRLKPVGPPNLSLSEANNNTATSANISPRGSTERPLPALPALPVQPTIQQLPPRNANLPGRQIKPLVEPLQKPKADEMGSSKSKPVPPESLAPVPRRPLQSSTLPRTIQANPEKVGSAPATSGREDRQPKSEGNTMRPAEYTQKRLEVSTPVVLAPPVKDLHFPITKVPPEPSTTAAEASAVPYHGAQKSQSAGPKLLPSQIPPSKPSESYSVASNPKSSASRPRQTPPSENANLFRGRDLEESKNDKLVTVPSPSNYTDNSASVSPLKDSNDSITPPSSYPDEDDRPLTPLNAPPADKSIIWNLNTVQYRCYVEHRNMKLSRNERHPMPCMLCNVADQEPRRKCTWCCLRICKGCHWLLTEACGKSVESLIDMLAREGKTGDEVREKTEGVSKPAANV